MQRGTSLSKANNRSITQLLPNSGFYSRAWGLRGSGPHKPFFAGEDGFWVEGGKMCRLGERVAGGCGLR